LERKGEKQRDAMEMTCGENSPKLAGYGAQPEVGKDSEEPAVGGGSIFVWIGVCCSGVEEWRL
jgi:hypothetical protein